MAGSYLTAALRSLSKSWTHTFINIFGLAIGLAASLAILIYVRYELTYDHWLPDSKRVYQLQTTMGHMAGGEPSVMQMSSYGARVALERDFPQIERLVYASNGHPKIFHAGQEHGPDKLLMVDGPFFDVLHYPFVQGDPKSALAKPGSVVLTERQAEKFFGTGPALGQVLTFTARDHIKSADVAHDYRVTGVIRDLPKNTHLDFLMVARFETGNAPPYVSGVYGDIVDWGCTCGYTYFKLRPGADPAVIAAAMPAWKKRNFPPRYDLTSKTSWQPVNVRDVHLGKAYGSRPVADKGFIISFALIAFLILAMACINFTNLSTARASRRAREVALRKLLGASRRQLIVQFLLEALLFTALAMATALALVELLMPRLSHFLDADLSLSYLEPEGSILPILVLTLLVGVASGLYPALYLSRFMPARVLKANASASEAPGSARLRQILVVAQFAISIGLIICTAVIYSQIEFGRTVDPGYRRSGLLMVSNFGALEHSGEAFAQEAARLPGIRGVSQSSVSLVAGPHVQFDFTEPGMAEPFRLRAGSADAAFFQTLGIPLLAGRTFEERRPADDVTTSLERDPEREAGLAQRSTNIVLNELAMRRLGFRDPASAIGKSLKASIGGGGKPAIVIGVVGNARFGSVREPIDAAAFYLDRREFWFVTMRYEDANPVAVRRGLEALWHRFRRGTPIQIEFSDDIIGKLYDADEKRGKVFAAFSLVAILIACLGLYGLAAFTAARRTKEIGIRKVLGARNRDIVRLLIWQFSKPVLIANLIAWPVAWWVMRDWLNGFDARISLTPLPFVAAGLAALVIAAATVARHATKVARAHPIAALRYE